MSGRRLGAALAVSAYWLLGLSACSLVLGIDEARVDPTLSDPTAGAAGSVAEDGGTGASGGTAGAGGSGGEEAGIDANVLAEASVTEAGSDAQRGDAAVESGVSTICSEYCEQMDYCTGNSKQYLDKAMCLKVCSLFPPGAIVGTTDGNTAACRLKYASKARYALGTERDIFCNRAGPGSDGTCGGVCDGFCTLMMPTCTAAKTAPYFYASLDACLSECHALRDNPPYTVSNGLLPDRNDAQCRLFHVTTAVMDTDEHCEHSLGLTMCDGKVDGGD